MNTRLVFTVAALPADQARAIISIICGDATTPDRTRMRMEKRYKQSLDHVLNFARHETLRKLHRYGYSHRAIMGQDQPDDHHDAQKIVFNPDELKQDLEAMILTETPAALDMVVNDTLKLLGFTGSYSLPMQDKLNFIAKRQNLLSGVSDEIYQEIKKEIGQGLIQGEPIRDIATRVTQAFDQIGTGRATVIATQETAAAYAFASFEAAMAAGITHKKWIHSVIPKVPRPDHLAIDGLIVPIEEPYPVGDPPLMYPHDTNGSAEDVINCGCISVPVTAQEYEAQQRNG